MNFIEYTPQTLEKEHGRAYAPAINIYINRNAFLFNKPAITTMGIRGGDCVKFVQSKEDQTKWFLEIVEDDGFMLRKRYQNNATTLYFTNPMLLKKVIESLGITQTRFRLIIDETTITIEGREFWPIQLFNNQNDSNA